MKYLTVAFALAMSACATAPQHDAAKPRPDHPYLGKWSWVYRGCTETYEHRPDGTSNVTSGAEIGASTYIISDEAAQSGFYRLVDVVTRSNGMTGCDDTPGGTPIGDEVVLFVFIRPSGEQMLLCQTESLDQCMGPLQRVLQ